MSEIVSIGPPTMSAEGFEQVLIAASSPAAATARQCYEAICFYGVDPAFALAIYCHESTYGKKGKALRTLNWGNCRWGAFADYNTEWDHPEGKWAWYRGADAWIRSAKDCARLLKKYADEKMSFSPCRLHAEHKTPPAIFHHWAPSADGNAPAAYAAHVERLVETYRKNWPVTPPGPSIKERVEALEREVAAWRAECSEMNRQIGELKARVEALEEE